MLVDLVGGRMLVTREAEIQHELISAGFFNIGPRRFLGYRVHGHGRASDPLALALRPCWAPPVRDCS